MIQHTLQRRLGAVLLAASALSLWGSGAQAAPFEPREAPAFAVATEAGKLNLADFKGKVVYLDFWASWCVPCRASFKWLNEMHDKYGTKGLVVLAVNVDKDKALAAQFLKDSPAKFRIGYDPEGLVAAAYQLKGMPSSYTVDRKGVIQGAHVGFRDKDKEALEQQLKALLGTE